MRTYNFSKKTIFRHFLGIAGQYTMGAWEMADGVSSTIIDSDLLCSGETAQDTHALNVRAQSYNNRCLYVDDSTLTRKTLCESPILPPV